MKKLFVTVFLALAFSWQSARSDNREIKTFCFCKTVPDRHYVSYIGIWLDNRYYATLSGIEVSTGKSLWEKPFSVGFDFYSDCSLEIKGNPGCRD